MKRLLGLLLVLGFVFSSSLYAVAYSEDGYSFFYSDDEEPYVNQYCNEEQMGWFDDYVDCTEKFLALKWGRPVMKIRDINVPGHNWRDEQPPIGMRFSVDEDFAETEDYMDIFDKGALVLYDDYYRNLTCWEKDWGNGSEVYNLRSARLKSFELWNKYYAYETCWHTHFDDTVRGTIENNYYKNYEWFNFKMKLKDKVCGAFVKYCSTGKVSWDTISSTAGQKTKNQVNRYRSDGIEVLHVELAVGGPTASSYLVATPDDCLRYYKGEDLAFSQPHVLGGK
jgi:hypothetical protein